MEIIDFWMGITLEVLIVFTLICFIYCLLKVIKKLEYIDIIRDQIKDIITWIKYKNK